MSLRSSSDTTLTLITGIATGLLVLGTICQASADPVKTGAQLYLNLSGDNLGDKIGAASASSATDPAASDSASSKKFDLGSVPLTISAADSTSGWDAALGGTGLYVTPLSDSFSFFGHGGFTKSQSDTGGLFGNTALNAGPGLQYQQGSFAMALQPDVGVSLQSDAVQQVDYGISSLVSKDLMQGLTATSNTGYTIQAQSDGTSNLANESAGLAYTLPNKVKLGLGYQIEQTLDNGASFLSGKQGPTVSAQMPVTNTFNLGTTYAYSSAASSSDGDAAARGRDVTQTLGVTADWDVGANFNADMTVKANLNVSRETTASTGTQALTQAGSVNMQMKF